LPASPEQRPLAALARSALSLGRLAAQPGLGTDGLGADAIVFAPHPDDEVLGCGGTVALKVAAGARIRVVVMTDGRASHGHLIDAPSLIKIRREEAERAAPHLGLSAGDYVFLEFQDHHLHLHTAAAKQRVQALLTDFNPAQVFVPHRRDRLSDHVATFDIVRAALRAHGKPVTVFEYPVWLWHTWPWTAGKPHEGSPPRAALRSLRDVAALAFGCRTRIDVHAVMHRKRAALAEYASQVSRRNGDPDWPVLADVSNGAFLGRFETGIEIFRQSSTA
jgi:LmbE family N-acetylglucosaminyl deacetylase